MVSTAELRRAVEQALAYLVSQPGVLEAEVFAAANQTLLTRLNYTSDIPCNGVEEPKSAAAYGLGVQVALHSRDGLLLGFGAEPSDLGPSGVARAFDKARRGAVRDPDFVSLPRPGAERRSLWDYHDPRILALDDEELVAAGWKVLNGSLRAFLASSRLAALAPSESGLARLGLIVGGDVTILQERIAIASSHMPDAQTDESTLLTSLVSAMVEARNAKGSGWSTGTHLATSPTKREWTRPRPPSAPSTASASRPEITP